MVDRPVIGLCATHTMARYGPWEEEAVLLPRDYTRAVHRAGALALLLVPDPVSTEHPDEILDRIDGLVLAGGADVGEDPERDAFEMALGRRALER
ncbi:MAG: putative glutamine amidotransferase, partial [Solirubrobacteraceae bacterium]|nr:putative glutamine amidotransferase [Solirubrobacteraceae bacterium]